MAIVRNPDVTGDININVTIKQLFQHDFWGYNISDTTSHKSYRPLTILTFRFEYLLYNGLNPVRMKIMNLFLHCIISCCVLIVVKRINNGTFNDTISFVATILFTVHPIHCEAVSGIVGRADLLCTLIGLISILIYLPMINGGRRKTATFQRFMALTICSIIAILCKETGIMVLPLCFACDLVINTNICNIPPIRMKSFKIFDEKRLFFQRFSLTICITCALMYFRMWIINFEQPKFKAMDNPIAASDCLTTKVGISGCNIFFFLRHLNNNFSFTDFKSKFFVHIECLATDVPRLALF